MIAEAIEKITELAHDAEKPQAYTPPGEPAHVYYLEGKRQIAAPAPRQHKAADLQAVVAFALRTVEQEPELPDVRVAALGQPATCCTVWYDRTQVTCLLDDATRRDRVTLKLELSPQFTELAALDGKRRSWKQPDLILWLRVNFSKALDLHPELLKALRSLRWQTSSDGSGVIAHGKASLGKSIQAELSGAELIPETVTFNVPVFHGCMPGLWGLVPCVLDINAKDETIALIPLAGAIEKALRDAEERLGEMLKGMLGDEFGRLYYGQP